MKDVERTNQATLEGPSKWKQKQSKVNQINIKTLKLIIMNWNCYSNVHVNQTIKGVVYPIIFIYINLFISFVSQAILKHGCNSSKLMLSILIDWLIG